MGDFFKKIILQGYLCQKNIIYITTSGEEEHAHSVSRQEAFYTEKKYHAYTFLKKNNF